MAHPGWNPVYVRFIFQLCIGEVPVYVVPYLLAKNLTYFKTQIRGRKEKKRGIPPPLFQFVVQWSATNCTPGGGINLHLAWAGGGISRGKSQGLLLYDTSKRDWEGYKSWVYESRTTSHCTDLANLNTTKPLCKENCSSTTPVTCKSE